MVVEGIGVDPFPGALGGLTPGQLANLRQVRQGYDELGVIPAILNDRIDQYHAGH